LKAVPEILQEYFLLLQDLILLYPGCIQQLQHQFLLSFRGYKIPMPVLIEVNNL